MRDPYNEESNAVFRRLGLKLFVGFFVLFFERLVTAYWPAFTWLCVFASVWISGFLPYSQSLFFFAVSFIFYFGFFYLLQRGWKCFSLPRHAEVYRRMELSSRQRHRPTAFFSDQPANGKSKQARAFWEMQKSSWLSALPKLKVASSKPVMLYKDPYGICFIAFTMIFFSLVVGGSASFNRLQNGLLPLVPIVKANLEKELVTVRIIPPEYTRIGETTLSGQGTYQDVMKIPEGSLIKIVVREQRFTPTISFGSDDIEAVSDTENPNSYVSEIVASHAGAGSLQVRGFVFNILRMSYEIVPDEAPSVSFAGAVEALDSGRISIPLLVSDDYGITGMRVDIEKDPAIFDYPLGDAYSIQRSLYAGANHMEEEVRPMFDFTPHTWSGLPVILNINVQDHYGHSVTLDPIPFTLPERNFTSPASKFIIEQRQRLAWAPIGSAHVVSSELENLVYQPEFLKGDKVAFLALRSAASRLYYSPALESAEAVIPLLWKAALKLEDGDVSILLDELRQLQQELENALRDPNTPDEKIAELTQKLQQKMMEYMQALAQRMQDPRNLDSSINSEMLQEMVDTKALNDFLAEMAESAMNGERDKAKQMLSEFQQLMDSLSSPESMQMPQDVEAMMETLKGLQDLIQEQKELLEQTREDLRGSEEAYSSGTPDYGDTELQQDFENGLDMGDLPPMPSAPGGDGAQPQPGGNSPGGKDGNKAGLSGSGGQGNNGNLLGQQRAGAQSQIQDKLGQLSDQYSEKSGQSSPENMGSAKDSMGKSAQQLSRGNGRGSIPHQVQAIEDLQDAMQQMSQQLQQRMQNMMMMTLGGSSPGRQGEQNGPFGTRSVDIPEGSQRKRIDDIIELLRDKSGEWDRPAEEREYYRRLLRKF